MKALSAILLFMFVIPNSFAAEWATTLNEHEECSKEIHKESHCLLDFVIQNELQSITILSDESKYKLLVHLMSSMLVRSIVSYVTVNDTMKSLLFLSNYLTHSNQYVVIMCNIEHEVNIIRIVHHLGMFNKRFKWIFIRDGNSVEEFVNSTQIQESLTPNSNIFVLSALSQTSICNTNCKIVRLSHKRVNASNTIAVLPHKRLRIRQANKEDEDFPLLGYELKIGILHAPPIVSVNRNIPEPIFGGYVVEVIQLLSRYLGFNIKFIVQESNVYGILINGSWVGLLGSVYRNEVDVGGFAFALTLDRKKAADFSSYMYTLQFVPVIRRPPAASEQCNFWVFLKPLSVVVWLVCTTMCVIISFCAACTLKSFSHSKASSFNLTLRYSFGQLTWGLVAALLQTGATDLPQRRSTRIMLLTFFLFIFLITKTYLSFLTASLAVKMNPKMYNNLDELMDDRKLGIVILNGAANHEMLENAKFGTLKRAWKKIKSDRQGIVSSNKEAYELVKSGRYVYFTADKSNAIPTIMESNCTMQMLSRRYLPVSLHLVFPRHSPLVEVVSRKLLAMRSAGILQKIERKYFPKYDPSLCKSEQDMTIPLQLFIGAIAVICIGILLVLCSFIFEIVLGKQRDSSNVKCLGE